jgi:hypothetical protein
VRVIDSVTGTQQILTGEPGVTGFADGKPDVSRFRGPLELALSQDEKTLYVCDQNSNRVRAVDTTSGDTHTAAGSGEYENVDGFGTAVSVAHPRSCDWDRASDVEPFTFLYVTSAYAMRRFNVKTGQMTTLKLSADITLSGIACLPGSGVIVVSCCKTRCLWTIDPRTAAMERLAGAMKSGHGATSRNIQTEWEDPFLVTFHAPHAITWSERDRSILVVDRPAHAVLRVPLSNASVLRR